MRPVLRDMLMAHAFWLLDVAPIELLALPVLTPLFGFATITAPEISVEVEEIREGNWYFPRKVVKSGNVSEITLTRGATFYDADFWRWTLAALQGDTEALQSRTYGLATTFATADSAALGGNTDAQGAFGAQIAASIVGGILGFPKIGGPTYRRDMLLLQFFPNAPLDPLLQAGLFAAGGVVSTQATLATTQASLAVATAGRSIFNTDGNALVQAAQRLPARSWMLRGCIPIRYKAASDFDASASEISVQELSMAVEDVEEISLST